MLRVDTPEITLRDIPDEVTLAFPVLGCPHGCKGCHWQEYNKKQGESFTTEYLTKWVDYYKGVTCVLFYGGDWDKELKTLIHSLQKYDIKIAVYSGKNTIDTDLYSMVDYYKVGAYNEVLGGLNNTNTNQKLIETTTGECLNHLFKRRAI